MNSITMKIIADKYIRMALEEDINSEDVSTNAVMPTYQKGEVQLELGLQQLRDLTGQADPLPFLRNESR